MGLVLPLDTSCGCVFIPLRPQEFFRITASELKGMSPLSKSRRNEGGLLRVAALSTAQLITMRNRQSLLKYCMRSRSAHCLNNF